MVIFRLIYALYMRFVGLALLVAGAGFLVLQSYPWPGLPFADVLPPLPELPPLPSIDMPILVASAVLGAVFFFWFVLPRGLRQPRRGLHLIWLVAHATVVWLVPQVIDPALSVLSQFDKIPPEAIAQVLDLNAQVNPLWYFVVPGLLSLILVAPDVFRGRNAGHDPALATPFIEKAPVSYESVGSRGIPALGGIMKLYGAVDWLVLRVLGLALLATAYMVLGMIQQGSANLPRLTFGQEPLHALYAYAALGMFLAVPFLTPRFISTPGTMLFAFIKCALLVGIAFCLLPALDVAITTFASADLHQTLQVAAPKIFKAVMGVSITSIFCIALFRSLGATPRLDYKGDPVATLTERQLKKLRSARMPTA